MVQALLKIGSELIEFGFEGDNLALESSRDSLFELLLHQLLGFLLELPANITHQSVNHALAQPPEHKSGANWDCNQQRDQQVEQVHCQLKVVFHLVINAVGELLTACDFCLN